MERLELSDAGKAVQNIKDIDILECSEQDIFEVMKSHLLKAFDNETTFDMRQLEQMELLIDECGVDIAKEKDGNFYPLIKLAIAIRDGYYDTNEQVFKIYPTRDAKFEAKFSPFTCSLDKFGENTRGIYSGSDKNLTTAWRQIMMQAFPMWEEKFKKYLLAIKAEKVRKVEEQTSTRIGRIKREHQLIIDRAEEDYKSELATVGLE